MSINMHHSTTSFIMYFIFCCINIPLGIIVNRTLFRNINKGNHREKGKIVQRIIKTYSIVQCISWPFILISTVILYFNKTAFKIIPTNLFHPAISIIRLICALNRNYVAFNSLIIATSRYIFVVFEKQIDTFKIRNVRAFLLTISVGVPMISTLLHQTATPTGIQWLSFFMPHTDEIQLLFANQSLDINDVLMSEIEQSPIYTFVHEYLPSSLINVIWFVEIFMSIAIYSNIIEGYMYAHCYYIIKRYDSSE